MKKHTTWILGLLLAGLVAFAATGCKKEAAAPPPEPGAVNMPKLQQAMSTSTSQEVQAGMAKVAYGLRYGNEVEALMALDKIKTDASVTDAQKKVIDEVMEQIKAKAKAKEAAAEPAK